MATEKFANNAATTLSGAISDSALSLVVASATGFPVSGQFRVKIDNEIILVTGVSGTTYTVTRGQEGTTAVAHGDGATVTHVLTAGALTQLQTDTLAQVPNSAYITSRRIPTDSGTQICWAFNESSAGIYSNSGSGGTLDLTTTSGTSIINPNGIFGNSLLVNGSTNKTASTTVGEATNFTLSCWVVSSDLSGKRGILVKYYYNPAAQTAPYGLIFRTENSGTLFVYLVTGGTLRGGYSLGALVLGSLYFLSVTYDGSTIKGYINGNLVLTQALTGPVDWGNHGPWEVGHNAAFSDVSPWVGTIDDVRIENVVRSDTYLARMYKQGLGLVDAYDTSAYGWVTALDVDFTTLGSISLATDGAYSFGGAIWTKINSANDAVAASISAADGLKLSSASNSNADYSQGTNKRNVSALTLALSSVIPNFNLSMGVRVWLYNSSISPVNANYQMALLALDRGDVTGQTFSIKKGYLNGPVFFTTGSVGASETNVTTTLSAIDGTNNVIVMEQPRVGSSTMYMSYGAYGGDWPSLSSLTPGKNPIPGGWDATVLTQSNMQLVIGAISYPGPAATIKFNRIRIEYQQNPSSQSLDKFSRQTGIDSNTVAQWKLQDASGSSTILETKGLNPLSVRGSPTLGLMGNLRGCAKFVSASSLHGASTLEPSGTSISIDCWCLILGSTSGYQYLIMKGYNSVWGSGHFESIGLTVSSSGTSLTGWMDTGSAEVSTTGATITLGDWHHVGMTYDGSNIRIYLDGDLVETKAQAGSISWGTHQDWVIGNIHVSGTERYFNGKIEDARVHNVVRPLSYFQNVWLQSKGVAVTAFAAGGDLIGTSSTQTVAKIQGTALDPVMSGVTTGDVLTWDGSKWTHLPTQVLPGGGWIVAADIDLTAQASQSLSSDGNYTIGGLTWSKQNSTNDNTAMALTNGTGLVISPKLAATYYASTRSAPLIWLPLSQLAIPGLSLDTGLRIWAYVSADDAHGNFDDATFGLDNNSMHWSWNVFRGYGDGTGGTGPQLGLNRTINQSRTMNLSRNGGLSDANRVVVLHVPRIGGTAANVSYAAYSSGWPSVGALIPDVCGVDGTGEQGVWRINSGPAGSVGIGSSLGVFFGASRGNGTSGGTFTLTYARIKVEYCNGAGWTQAVRTVTPVTANYQVTSADDLISIGALTTPITVTLPASPVTGETHDIKDSGGTILTYNVIVAGNGYLIDGFSTFRMDQNYGAFKFVFNGTSWMVF